MRHFRKINHLDRIAAAVLHSRAVKLTSKSLAVSDSQRSLRIAFRSCVPFAPFSGFAHPRSSRCGALALDPIFALQDRSDAPLVGGTDLVGRDKERVFCDFEDCYLCSAAEVFGDRLFPSISLKAGILFGNDVCALELRFWPPVRP